MAPVQSAAARALLCLLYRLLIVSNVSILETLASIGYNHESLLRIRDKVSGFPYVIPELRCEDFALCPTHRHGSERLYQNDGHLGDETPQCEGGWRSDWWTHWRQHFPGQNGDDEHQRWRR